MSAATEPSTSGQAGAERWIAYLDWARSELSDAVLALSPAAQRTSRVPSGWTPLELLSHVLHMEQRWFVWGFLGEPVDAPWGDWTRPDPFVSDDSDDLVPDVRWTAPDTVTAEMLSVRLAELGRRTTSVLRTHALSDLAATTGRFADADPPSLEWICFHVLAEYARHAGHLDIVVELSAP